MTKIQGKNFHFQSKFRGFWCVDGHLEGPCVRHEAGPSTSKHIPGPSEWPVVLTLL